METINRIKVGISDYRTGNRPDLLTTIGLGSCVGIAMFDPDSGLGGLSHIMLPDSCAFSREVKAAKFADLAVPVLVDELVRSGARRGRLQAKIAGGASMFNYKDKSLNMNIGERNVEAVQRILESVGIPLLATHVGGTTGRTMTLYLDSMTVGVKLAGQPEILI